MARTHYVLVVTADAVETTNKQAQVLHPDTTPWFTVALNPSGLDTAPPTHYVCGVLLTPEEETKLRDLVATNVPSNRAFMYTSRQPQEPETPTRKDIVQVLAARGDLKPATPNRPEFPSR